MKFDDIHYKSQKTSDEVACWNECENESACNSISFFNGDLEELYNRDANCFMFTNKAPKTLKNENFVSKMRKTKSNLNIY